jgi:hypothetical protein
MKIDENTLKLCYLFLSLDKTISKDNLEKFTEIGMNYNSFESKKKELISECEQIIGLSISEYDRFAVISTAIKEIALPNESNAFSFSPLSNRSGQRECLWLLECLLWQDGNGSENEKKIIRSLAEQWKIDEAMVHEMEDTARTLYEIDNYRSFLKTSHEFYSDLNRLSRELDKSQNEIIDSMFETLNI